MGKISVVLKIMPENEKTDLDSLQDEIKDRIDVDDIGTEEVAFGLKAVKVSTMTTDEEGGTDYLENQLKDIEEVQSIEIEHFNKV